MSVIGRPSAISIIDSLEQVVSDEETAYVRAAYTEVNMSGEVLNYLMDIVEGTRRESNFVKGVSTRGAIALYKAAQVTAAFHGRDYVIPEDVKYAAPYVLAHRISQGSTASAQAALGFLNKIIENARVPLETV